MNIEFTKNMIVSSKLKRLFWEQTTPVDKFPAFTNLSCRLVDSETVANGSYLCVNQIHDIMQADNCNVIKAIVKLMKIYNIAKVTEFKLTMSKALKGKYLPVKCTMILKDMCVHENESLSCKISNVTVNIAKHDKCATSKYATESLYGTNWTPICAEITGCLYENIDIENNLWHKRTELLKEYNEYVIARDNNLPLPPDNNVIFVVLSPNDTLGTTAWKSEGANDIDVTGFAYNWETSKEIYEDILCNNLAIIREDLIEHPTSKNTIVRVYTLVYVNIIKSNIEINNGETDNKCSTPLRDCLIMHMGEINLLRDVKISWEYGLDVEKIEPIPERVNIYQPTKLRIQLAPKYGDVFNYTATFIDKNIDNLNVDMSQDETFNIPNKGCGCSL